MKSKSFSLLFFLAFSCLCSMFLHGQSMAIGEWNIHLPYRKCISLSGNTNKMFAATESGLFALNRADNSLERINKVNGLSDINIKTISWNESRGLLFVGYKNANIDIVKGKDIINLPDIKRAQIVGNKTVNGVHFIGGLAYVACGFGIVVIDLDRMEIKDTYYIGPNGSYLEVYEILSDGTKLYVATGNGVYSALLNDPNLANFNAWTKFVDPILLNGPYNQLAIFDNKLFVNYSRRLLNGAYELDVLLYYDFNTLAWDTFPGQTVGTYNINDMAATSTRLYLAENYNIFGFTNTLLGPPVDNVYDYNLSTTPDNPYPEQIFVDNGGTLWSADKYNGLVKIPNAFQGIAYYPNGPNTPNVFGMAISDGQLVVAPGGKNDAWGNIYNTDGAFVYRNGFWKTYNHDVNTSFDTLFDIHSAAIDPENPDHFYLGSWGKGLIEMSNGNILTVHGNWNSTLASNVSYQWVGIGGLAYDDDGNLWVTNSHALTCLNVRKPDGSWQAFNFSGLVNTGTTVSQVLVTQNKHKWMILPRGGGILVFDDAGTLSNTSDDRKKKLGFTTGAGNIVGSEVFCFAEDKDGEIWVGTEKGISVFYSPESVFNSSGFDAQQILIEQDGYVQILLETQIVTAIAVDGANRKWIGTEGGGVFLMSEDGTKQIAHFDADNSPLLSNTITAITINQKTGEVFIGTDKGIVSYKGEAIEGGDTNEEVYAYPNPVKPEYDGVIAIRGVVKDADVKIADVRGNVIYETKALGGQAIWNGRNFKGERAASGVYLVFVTNEDGSQTAITKILFVN